MVEQKNCFFSVMVKDFLNADTAFLMEKMSIGFQWYKEVYRGREEYPSPSQMESWRDCFDVLREALAEAKQSTDWLVFEYCLPQEGGRRPDVLLINSESVVILEFKRKGMPALAQDVDQTAAYLIDLKECHGMSHDLVVESYLVLTKEYSNIKEKVLDKEVTVISRSMLRNVLGDRASAPEIDILSWLQAPYEPSITILEAAHRVMEGEELPEIRRAKSIGINETLKKLEQLYHVTKKRKTHSIVFITGVPGAGKTYLGLQYVYHISKEGTSAVYLSGNTPLINILQHILKDASRVIVKHIRKFLSDDEKRRGNCTTFVFDEGQRAWNNQDWSRSEPADLLKQLHSLPWGMMVVLIGEGQQIWTNETVEPSDWARAIAKYGQPNLFCPPDFQQYFAGLKVTTSIELNLTNSLRTPMDAMVPQYIKYLLDGNISKSFALSKKIRSNYSLYLTRDPEQSVKYCVERYTRQPKKKYGWVRSSQYNRKQNARPNQTVYVPWFVDEPTSPRSCCSMNRETAMTEFACQGLELDFVAMEWGLDLLWEDGWHPYCTIKNKEHETYRINAYRVLLTRGRDGLFIYVPKEEIFDDTFNALKKAGFVEV